MRAGPSTDSQRLPSTWHSAARLPARTCAALRLPPEQMTQAWAAASSQVNPTGTTCNPPSGRVVLSVARCRSRTKASAASDKRTSLTLGRPDPGPRHWSCRGPCRRRPGVRNSAGPRPLLQPGPAGQGHLGPRAPRRPRGRRGADLAGRSPADLWHLRCFSTKVGVMGSQGRLPDASGGTVIVLLTRDLRLCDQPALAAACRGGHQVIPLFVHDPALLNRSNGVAVPASVSG